MQTAIRKREQERMDQYVRLDSCLMQFLARELDDPEATACGKCTPCQGKLEVMRETPPHLEQEAVAFLQRSALVLRPRKQWPTGAMPSYGWNGKIRDELREEVGWALRVLKDGGWGRMVYQARLSEGRSPTGSRCLSRRGLPACLPAHTSP